MSHLKPEIEALEARVRKLPEPECHELELVITQCRQLLEAGDFIIADEVLSQIAKRLDDLGEVIGTSDTLPPPENV